MKRCQSILRLVEQEGGEFPIACPRIMSGAWQWGLGTLKIQMLCLRANI